MLETISFPIFAKLGGEDATLATIELRRGKRPSLHAVRYWKTQRSLPAIIKEILQEECERLGIEWSREDFVSQVPKRETSPSDEVAA